MKKYLLIAFLLGNLQMAIGQTFSTNTSANIGGGFGYLANGIAVSGLGNLDGTNLGITSIEMTITAGLSQVKASIEMYLVAPDGHAVYIMNQGSNFFTTNGLFIFTIDPTAPNFRTWPGSIATNNTYTPYGNLNAFNIGIPANGNWRLYAVQKNFGVSAAITSWKINFGTSNIVAGNKNQSCTAATPLINTTQTGNFVSGTNQYSGIVIADSKGAEVGNSGLTETSIWYSFVPKCKDDKIQIVGAYGYIQASILGGNCSSRTRLSTNTGFLNTTANFNVTNYTPGNTYFVLMDGSEGEYFQYDIKWFEGTTGCLVNSITTSATPKTSYCAGDSIYVGFTTTGTYAIGNRFTAELSDANGNFTSPTIIGFKDASSASSIPTKLPNTLASGTGYKIRINASNPAVTGTANAAFQILNIPVTPTSLVGSLSVCAGASNQTYSVGSVANANRYRWKFTSGTFITSAATDSINVKVNLGTSNSLVSVQAINVCGASAALERTITVNPNLVPSVSVVSNLDTICQGDSVRFTATATNGGTIPIFLWKINQTNSGGNAPIFRTKALKKSDTVSVILTSNENCLTKTSATSNKFVVFVRDTLKPTVSISGSNSFCQGSTVNFSASSKNKGNAPVFSWYVNKTKQSATDSLFNTSTLQNNDTIRVQLQSNKQCARPSLVSATPIVVKVVSSIVPTISISGNNSGCEGSLMTFDANYSGGGANPVFTWKLNTQILGGTGSSYSYSQFKSGDILEVSLKSDDACANPVSVVSNPITLSIQTKRTPTVTIQAIKTGICQGDSFSFQAQSTFAGLQPNYVWKVNNVSIQNSTNKFASKSLKNGDSVKVELTSNDVCLVSSKANTFQKVILIDTVVPSIILSGSNSFCQGSTVNFSASTKNKGNAPVFSWHVNKIKQSAADSLFNTSTLQNNDTIRVQLLSNKQCAKPSLVSSNYIAVKVVTTIVPTVSIVGSNSACEGSLMNFDANYTGGGTNPVFSWKLNNQIVGGTGSSYSNSQFKSGDILEVSLKSDDACANPVSVVSNPVTLSIQSKRTPTVSLQVLKQGYCLGDSTVYQANATFGGANPEYIWKVNGNPVQNTSSKFTAKNLQRNDSVVSVELISSESCIIISEASDFDYVSRADSVTTTIRIIGSSDLCAGTSVPYLPDVQSQGFRSTFKWLVNGKIISEVQQPIFINNLKNNDTIWAIVQNFELCSYMGEIMSNKIVVKVHPIVNYTTKIEMPNQICEGDSATFLAKTNLVPAFYALYLWNVNGNALPPSLTPELKIPVFNGDKLKLEFDPQEQCAVPETVVSDVVTVNTLPKITSQLDLQLDTIICKEQAIPVFASTTQAGLSPVFSWKSDGNSISETSSSHVFENLAVGQHTIEVMMTSSEMCTAPVSTIRNILVKDSVSANISITGNTVLCAGSNATFQLVSNPNLSNQTYNWLKNGNKTGNTDAIFQTNTLANNDQIVLQVETNEMCIASKTLTSNTLNIEVISATTPELNWSVSETEICPGEEIIYLIRVTNAGNRESYKWLLNTDTLKSETRSSLTLSPKATDVVSLEYKTVLDCGIFSTTVNAPAISFKNPAPILTTISGASSYCASEAEIVFQTDLFPNATYSWLFPSFSKANIDRNTIRLNLNGNTSIDTLKVSASNECGTGNTVRIVIKAQDCLKLFIPNAIVATDEQGNNIWQIKGMELYPNAKISVFNRWGMNVFQSTGYTKPFDGTINGKPLPSGTYYYVIDGIQEKPLIGDLTIVH